MGQYLRISVVAKRLDCKACVIREMIRDGKLKAIKLGPRRMRVCAESLEKYLQECKGEDVWA